MNPVSPFTRLHIALQRSVRWEFWPWQVVYLPVAVYWFFLALKARGWVFFSAANPCMRFGGLVAYSKSEVNRLVPEQFLPRTVLIAPSCKAAEIEEELKMRDMGFPLIIKPDEGERGKGVVILRDRVQLHHAIGSVHEKMLLQVFEDLPLEFGVLYSRHPDEAKGRITSIVIKEFPVLTGDGKHTLLQLILSELRTRLNYKVHVKRFREKLYEIPKNGERIEMVQIGNHMLGTTFLNGNHLITDELCNAFDSLAKQINGFYIGRFDVRTSSIEDLEKGNFKVIEVNGINSEPAHIYDPDMPLWKGLRDLLRNWKRIYRISVANHQNGIPYDSFGDIRSEIRRHRTDGASHA